MMHKVMNISCNSHYPSAINHSDVCNNLKPSRVSKHIKIRQNHDRKIFSYAYDYRGVCHSFFFQFLIYSILKAVLEYPSLFYFKFIDKNN